MIGPVQQAERLLTDMISWTTCHLGSTLFRTIASLTRTFSSCSLTTGRRVQWQDEEIIDRRPKLSVHHRRAHSLGAIFSTGDPPLAPHR